MFTARMKQLIAVVLDHDADRVTKELLRQSVLHFVNIKEITSSWKSKVDSVTPKISEALIGEIRKRIESFLDLAGYKPGSEGNGTLDVEKLKALDLDETNKALDNIAAGLQGRRDRQRTIQQEILRFEDIKRQLDLFGDLRSGIQARSQYSFLSIQTGSVRSAHLEAFSSALKALPSVRLNFREEEDHTALLLITMKRDEARVNKILDKYGWVDVELSKEMSGARDEVINDLETKLAGLRSEQEGLNDQIRNLIEEKRAGLDTMWANLRMNELYYKIQSYFSKTARTMLFTGWLPAEKQGTLDESIKGITGGRCYLEWNDPKDVQKNKESPVPVPVQLKNPRFLRPFQMLVQNYSIPEYGTVDPTPFVAVAYLIMFGLMFGDAGHGALLFITGLISSIAYKGRNEGIHNLLKLIAWCGLSAIITGILFGAYFGMQLFKPLWFDYHGIISGQAAKSGFVKDVYGILVITIYFGISVIGLGLVLNWINLVARRRWFGLIMDKGGLIGGWIYGAGVYVAYYFVSHDYKAMPAADLLFWLLGLPAIILIFKPPLEFTIRRRKNPAEKFTILTPIDFFMEWIVEMLEIFSGYLANTLSFMRVAGLGIAHVSLMIAFFEIARMVSGGASYNIWSILVLVLGNILVIALEGLSAGVQSLRLNYYEFFSKYFSGSGIAYKPVSLRSLD